MCIYNHCVNSENNTLLFSIDHVVGPFCEYIQTSAASDALSNCGSFQEYLNGLSRASCPPLSSPNFEASFTWTPDDTTPDNLYYQVSTKLKGGG